MRFPPALFKIAQNYRSQERMVIRPRFPGQDGSHFGLDSRTLIALALPKSCLVRFEDGSKKMSDLPLEECRAKDQPR
jgi:hypothetical protein